MISSRCASRGKPERSTTLSSIRVKILTTFLNRSQSNSGRSAKGSFTKRVRLTLPSRQAPSGGKGCSPPHCYFHRLPGYRPGPKGQGGEALRRSLSRLCVRREHRTALSGSPDCRSISCSQESPITQSFRLHGITPCLPPVIPAGISKSIRSGVSIPRHRSRPHASLRIGGPDGLAEPVIVHLVDSVNQNEPRLRMVEGRLHDL